MEPIPEPISETACIQSEELVSAEQKQGILLYYKYVDLKGTDADDVACFYKDMCGRLDQRGRIRVARDGINVTVGGTLASLRAHTTAVTDHPILRGGDIDFKLATSPGPRNAATRHETGMEKLAVRMCEELVTLGPLARNRADPRASTAPHLTPEQFHDMIARAEAEAQLGAAPTAPAAAGVAEAASDSMGAGGVGDEGTGVGMGADDSPMGPVVLLDTRNVYETRIGHFEASAPAAIPTLDPRTRCFSEFPAWVDAHEAELRGRTVLMYCTGGVRCERASAYLREKGPGFNRVYQLSGGIQRYLERFPDGGFFRGKNFLYDDRIAVGPETVVGRCLLCDRSWDDYGKRQRCSRCRLLLLVCDECCREHGLTAGAAGAGPDAETEGGPCNEVMAAPAAGAAAGAAGPLLCELCRGVDGTDEGNSGPQQQQQEEEAGGTSSATATGAGTAAGTAAAAAAAGSVVGDSSSSGSSEAPEGPLPAATSGGAAAAAAAAAGGVPRRRLRILCLHGFRQTGKQFQGRTCALRKKLRDLAEFVFVDAPHSLPLFVKAAAAAPPTPPAATATTTTAIEVAPNGAADSNVADGNVLAAVPDCLDDVFNVGCGAEDYCGDEGEGGKVEAEAAAPTAAAASKPAAAKRAWLLPLELYGNSTGAEGAALPPSSPSSSSPSSTAAEVEVQAAPSYVDELQYTRQTEGWRESLAAVQRAVLELGPFDGVFGFSQGAAVAAVLCALQQKQKQQQQQHAAAAAAAAGTASAATDGNKLGDCDFGFRFAILASGFPSPCAEHQALFDSVGPLDLPSLHVYGSAAAAAATAATSSATAAADANAGASEGCPTTSAPEATVSGDRQIPPSDSERLMAVFSLGSSNSSSGDGNAAAVAGGSSSSTPQQQQRQQWRRCLRHQCGHLIPATRSHAATFRSFLTQFVVCD